MVCPLIQAQSADNKLATTRPTSSGSPPGRVQFEMRVGFELGIQAAANVGFRFTTKDQLAKREVY